MVGNRNRLHFATSSCHASSRGPGAALLLLAFFAGGCAFRPPAFDWSREPGHRPLRKTVRVVPFEDGRPVGLDDFQKVAWIPLVPFGTTTFHQPGQRLGARHPDVDFPRILAAELAKAGIFETVTFSEPKGKDPRLGADLILEGEVRASRIEMRFFTYGLSLLAGPLYLLGVPMRQISLVLDMHVRVRDADSGEILWGAEARERCGQWQGVYYGRDFYHFPKLMARMAIRVSLELDRAAAARVFGE